MEGRRISHYRILEKLGEGGMGFVYKAEDVNLKRVVALKFLRPFAIDSEEQKIRFIQEARAAAALDHPNICTVYEIDEEDSQLFVAMAFIEGVTLKDKIDQGPLEWAEAVSIGVQMAEGVKAAHARGIIHRDIKSSNVMVTRDGQAKIMDFGIADVMSGRDDNTALMAAGTAAYMSPEQAAGERPDERTDIWSLGVCFYEMVTGQLPFRGLYAQAVMYAVSNEDPEPVAALRPGIPVDLKSAIEKMLAKKPEDRYQKIADVLVPLRAVEMSLKSGTAISASALHEQAHSIAVLPFTDMSPNQDQGYFCDGIAEEIINALTRIKDLQVISRTSAFSFKGKTEDAREIGKKLGVGTLLEGSVRKSGDRIRITAQLINVGDGYHIWSEKFDRELKDVFAIQDEISQKICSALQVRLTSSERQAVQKAPTHDVIAYDYYLRGRQFFYKSKKKSINFAREMFSQAIRKDPGYTLAYAGLADCHSYLYWYFERLESNLDAAMANSQKALDLDPERAEAHVSRGLALALGKRYQEAERQFETAIKLNPHLWDAYYFFARTCFMQGDYERAAIYFEKAFEVNPEDHQAPNLLGFVLRCLNRIDESIAVYKKGIEVARRHVALNPDDSRAYYLGSSALIEIGEKEQGLEWAYKALELDPDDSYILYGIACNFSRVGDVDQALRFFERTIKAGFAHKEWIEHDSDFDPIREHPRFKELLDSLE
jgi:serine/threonine protein kinase/Flp pilus assembly protein TadD